ncbi:MAG TPA: glycosyltransferase family 39 protein [Polyangia bacterium]|nr:glycosyltransferase family 39 protein [Polyangia bacterium]
MKAPRFSRAAAALSTWRERFGAASWEARVGYAIGAAAVLIAFAVSTCGINGPFPEGHFASSAAIGNAGFNMWRWKTAFPVVSALDRVPAPSSYYMHHPLGVFWTIALLGKLLGFSDWVLRLPPLFYVTVTPILLFKIGRALWRPIPAGLTALAYVALPITLGYANYHDLEQPVMFGCVLASWGYLRFARTGRDRYALTSVAGLLFAVNHDWPGYIWAAPFLAGIFLYAFVIPERLRARSPAPSGAAFGRYWALMAIALAVSLAIEIALLVSSGRISDVLGSYANRSSGAGMPLSVVLAARHYRINLMFTALAIVLGKLAVPVILARAFIRRDHLELLAIPLLLCAATQYLVFKQGADVHIFWPHYFASYFALAAGALAASVGEATVWIGARIGTGGDRARSSRARIARWAPWVALIAVGLPLASVLKDGLSLVRLSRETGGRFAEANLDSGLDVQAALGWFLARIPSAVTAGIAFHPGVPYSWSMQWENRTRSAAGNQAVAGAVAPGTRIYIMDTRAASIADLRQVASRFHVHAVEYVWLCDRQQPPAPLDGYVFDERAPSLWQRWSQGFTEPSRAIRPSAFVTWEWRTLLGQPAVAPAATPLTIEELRIAHNVAVDRGDAAGTAGWRAALAGRLNLPLGARYDGGTALIGGAWTPNGARSVRLFFVAGALPGDDRFAVHAKVIAPPHCSTLPVDPLSLETAGAPAVPTSLWRPGQIYDVRVVIRKRPGSEVWSGAWTPGPRREDAAVPVEILRL